MAHEFWLSDRAWATIEPLLPASQPGARRVDDRRVISGIIHVLQSGCRWKDCPSIYGPSTTLYNRFNRPRDLLTALPLASGSIAC
jgi:transposase